MKRFFVGIIVVFYFLLSFLCYSVYSFDIDEITIKDGFGSEHKILFDEDISNKFKYFAVIRYDWDNYIGTFSVVLSNDSNITFTLYNSTQAYFKIFGSNFYTSSDQYFSSSQKINMSVFTQHSGLYNLGGSSYISIACSNFDVYNDNNELIFKSSFDNFTPPAFQNKNKLQNLDFDNMSIFLNDYDSKERLYLHRLEVAATVDLGDGNTVYYYNDKVFGLDFFTSYYNNDPDHPGYTIPKYQFELENNKIYYFLLSSSASSLSNSYNLIDDYTKIENAYDGFGVSTSDNFTYEQLQQEQQKKQNDQLEENNKTNKNIFETIKEMLSYLNPFSDNFILLKLWDFLGTLISYINPFSDNFLGKKIVELIGNLLKSLFVPSDEYFNNFFSDLKQWFSDRFGLLFYPFELIIDILNRITNINLSEPKFNIPEIKEPSTGRILFNAQNYNFNDLLNTKEFKTMHDIYFVIVDAIIIFALANLIKSKLKEVETE